MGREKLSASLGLIPTSTIVEDSNETENLGKITEQYSRHGERNHRKCYQEIR